MVPLRIAFAALGGLLLTASVAQAGMPSVGLSEIGLLRTQTVSFFLLGLFVSAGLIQFIWNSLRADWPAVPRLGYWRSVGLVTLWGLMFLIVLTMISGARELLTPGAWEKVGLTHRVKSDAANSRTRDESTRVSIAEFLHRSEKLRLLGNKLQEYAAAHDGEYPSQMDAIEPEDVWEVPAPGRSRYLYVPGLTQRDHDSVLVREPAIFDGPALALLVSGAIRSESAATEPQP